MIMMQGILYWNMRHLISKLFVSLKLNILNSKEKEDLLNESKIRLIVANLSDQNLKLITNLSNIISVEGIIIKKR